MDLPSSCYRPLTFGLEVIYQHPGNTAGEADAGRQIKEFIRTVRVGVWPQYSSDHELRPRKLLTQHGHERDGSTFAHVAGFSAKKLERRLFERLLQPGFEGWWVPAGGALFGLKYAFSPMGRIFLKGFLKKTRRALGMGGGGKSERTLGGSPRPEDVASFIGWG